MDPCNDHNDCGRHEGYQLHCDNRTYCDYPALCGTGSNGSSHFAEICDHNLCCQPPFECVNGTCAVV